MKLAFPPLYAIIDAALLKTSELSFVEIMAESGVELLQYRNKSASSKELFEASQAISARLIALRKPGVYTPRFIVNDRADIALLVNARGVHVGQEDLGVEDARAIVGTDAWVGLSTHSLAQLDAAEQSSADYIAFGPIFPTQSKQNTDRVVGLELLREARARTKKPLVAIGGITLERAAETYGAGADSLAVARDLAASEDPGTRAGLFLREAARARRKV